MAPSLGAGLLGQIGVEQGALLCMLAPANRNAHAEDMLEGRLAGLEVRDEIGPGLPILLDHDLDFLGEPRRRAGARATARPGSARTAVRQAPRRCRWCTARAGSGVRCGADSPSAAASCSAVAGPAASRSGKPELDRGIDQCRLVIGLDLLRSRSSKAVDLSWMRQSQLVSHGRLLYQYRGKEAGESLPTQRRCYNHLP